jgi:hypothetical protein
MKDSRLICRDGEAEKHWYRSDRFFKANGAWYFTTRENIDIGPFGTMQNAQQGLALFIKNIQSGLSSDKAAASIAINGHWATTLYH